MTATLLLAMFIDVLTGEPEWIYRRVPHPAVQMGRLVALLDNRLNRPSDRLSYGVGTMRYRGVCAVAVLGFVAVLCALMLEGLLTSISAVWAPVLEAFLASTLIAHRSLIDHVKSVFTALQSENTDEGRKAVSMIVGRDPEKLDQPGIVRAALESLAENFSDGVVAPCMFYLLFGLPGLFLYKIVNTADSMIGHRTEKYLHFGWAAARLDDLLNFIPARFTGVLIVMASGVLSLRIKDGWRIMMRDANKHRSPNAGWPESALAGALDIRLSGPRVYGNSHTQEPWVGDGTKDVLPCQINKGIRLIWTAYGLFALTLVASLIIQAWQG